MNLPKPAFTLEFRDLGVKRVKAAAKGHPNGVGNWMVRPEEMEL